MELKIASNLLKNIPYIRVLQIAANQAAEPQINGSGVFTSFTFKNLKELYGEMREGEEEWLKEIIPEICTIRDGSGDEIVNPKKTGIGDGELLVIKSDEFIKFVTLLETENINKILEKSNELLVEAKSSNESAAGLLGEAKNSGKIANLTFGAAVFALILAAVVPPLVVKSMTSTVDIEAVSLSDNELNKLASKIGQDANRGAINSDDPEKPMESGSNCDKN